jgi:hypothetical protein
MRKLIEITFHIWILDRIHIWNNKFPIWGKIQNNFLPEESIWMFAFGYICISYWRR